MAEPNSIWDAPPTPEESGQGPWATPPTTAELAGKVAADGKAVVEYTDPKTGRTSRLRIPRSRLADAIKDGAREVPTASAAPAVGTRVAGEAIGKSGGEYERVEGDWKRVQ